MSEQKKKIRIGDLLVQNEVITEDQLMTALKEQKNTGRQQPRHKPGCNPEEPFGRTQFVKEWPHQLVTIFTVIVWLVAGPKEPISCSKD